MISHIQSAFLLLTRLPCGGRERRTMVEPEQSVWAYPLVGCILGGILYALATVASAGLPVEITAILILGASLLLTGAMHEDGLADCADGFWGAWTPEKRLKIMRDSQIGTYGVCTLSIMLLLRWQAFAGITVEENLLVIVGVFAFSRSLLPVAMLVMPYARKDGLAVSRRVPSLAATIIALTLGTGALILCTPNVTSAILMVCISIATLIGLMMLATAKIGGITGDVLGAILITVETAALLCLMFRM